MAIHEIINLDKSCLFKKIILKLRKTERTEYCKYKRKFYKEQVKICTGTEKSMNKERLEEKKQKKSKYGE